MELLYWKKIYTRNKASYLKGHAGGWKLLRTTSAKDLQVGCHEKDRNGLEIE